MAASFNNKVESFNCFVTICIYIYKNDMAYSGVAAMARNCIAAMAYSDMAASCHPCIWSFKLIGFLRALGFDVIRRGSYLHIKT